jgi:hypothetical protein
VSTFFSLIRHSTGVQSRAIRQEREIKGIRIGKEKLTLFLFADDMILYLKNLKTIPKYILELNNHFWQSSRISYKNQYLFYRLTMNMLRKKSRKESHSKYPK